MDHPGGGRRIRNANVDIAMSAVNHQPLDVYAKFRGDQQRQLNRYYRWTRRLIAVKRICIFAVIGAEAVIRKLLAANAIGLVTTHDLELAQLAEHLAPRAANVHFADEVVEGSLKFDYRLRPGVVKSSNALLLMRNLGLDV